MTLTGPRVCGNKDVSQLVVGFVSAQKTPAELEVAKASFQARIDCISVRAPKMLIARFMLYASTCRLISVRTLGSVLVRKWVAPIHALMVPKGCSTIRRRQFEA